MPAGTVMVDFHGEYPVSRYSRECVPTDTSESELGVVPAYWLSRYTSAPDGEVVNWSVVLPVVEGVTDVHPATSTRIMTAEIRRSFFIRLPCR